MSEGGAEQKGRFKIKNVNKATSEDGLGPGTPQSVTGSTFSVKQEDAPVVIETGSTSEQSSKDNKSKDGTGDSVSTLPIPVPGATKKKSRFIVKTVAKEDDEDEIPTPHTNTDSSKLRVLNSQSEDPSVVLAKMEQLMRSNMQIMSQMMDLTRSSLRASTSSPGPLSAGIAMGHGGGFSVPGSPVLLPPGTPVSFSSGVQGGANSLLKAATMGISTHAELPPLGQVPVSPAPSSTTTSTNTTNPAAASIVPHINTSLTLPTTIASAGSTGTPTSAGDGASHKSAFAGGGSTAGTPTNAGTKPAPVTSNAPSVGAAAGNISASDGSTKAAPSHGAAATPATAAHSTTSTTTNNTTTTSTALSDDKDAQFNKMSHYLLEMKKEVEQAQRQRRERTLETQRLREKVQQLEDQLTSAQRKSSRLEEQQVSHSGAVEALQTQILQLNDVVSKQSAELERHRLNMAGEASVSPVPPVPGNHTSIVPSTANANTDSVQVSLPAVAAPTRLEVQLPTNTSANTTSNITTTTTTIPTAIFAPTAASLASAQNYSSDGSIQRMDSNNSTNNSVNNSTTNPAHINNSTSSLNLEGYFLGTPPVSPPQALHKVVSGSAHNTTHNTHHSTLTQSTLFNHNQAQVSGGIPLPPPPSNSSVIYAPHSSSASSISVAGAMTDTQHPLVRTKSLNGSQTAPTNSNNSNNPISSGTNTTSNAGSYSQPSLMQQMMDMAVNNINSTNNTNNTNVGSNSNKQGVRGAPPVSGYSSGTATPTYRGSGSTQPVMLNYPGNAAAQQQLQGQGSNSGHSHSHHTMHALAPLPQHTQHHYAQHTAHPHPSSHPSTHHNTLAPHAQHAQHAPQQQMHTSYPGTLPSTQPSSLPNPHHLTPLSVHGNTNNMAQHNPLLPHQSGAFSQYTHNSNAHNNHTTLPTHTSATNNGLTLQYTPTYAQEQQRMYAGTPTNGNNNNQTGTGSPAFPTNPLNTFGVQGGMLYPNSQNSTQGSNSGGNSNNNSSKYPPPHAERDSSGNIHAHHSAPISNTNMHTLSPLPTQTGSNKVVHDDLDSIAARPSKPADHDFLSIDHSTL